eukprot:11258049-Alexandrium_andersonii.AAC.1
MAPGSLTPEERAFLWMLRFKPTLACPASDAPIPNLPPGYKEAQAERFECPEDAVELLVVVELPD